MKTKNQATVMIRFSAGGPYLLLVPQGRALIRGKHLFGTGRLFLFSEIKECSKQNLNIHFKKKDKKKRINTNTYSKRSVNSLRKFRFGANSFDSVPYTTK